MNIFRNKRVQRRRFFAFSAKPEVLVFALNPIEKVIFTVLNQKRKMVVDERPAINEKLFHHYSMLYLLTLRLR